ncbi:hypothetical protein BDW02DRAFT_573490 [Decorospora gaudefroyi]|uniref:Uncharacterized protein n=1 Tax=Decorospora gaudefroyi TaxID=184978 RepID=A0A6A5K1K3_9PLEO|nr:hypothetical protein BDW02DRAFT_573490 [Decorospora gaudefroyi]
MPIPIPIPIPSMPMLEPSHPNPTHNKIQKQAAYNKKTKDQRPPAQQKKAKQKQD